MLGKGILKKAWLSYAMKKREGLGEKEKEREKEGKN
jgi:hypothetical protein